MTPTSVAKGHPSQTEALAAVLEFVREYSSRFGAHGLSLEQVKTFGSQWLRSLLAGEPTSVQESLQAQLDLLRQKRAEVQKNKAENQASAGIPLSVLPATSTSTYLKAVLMLFSVLAFTGLALDLPTKGWLMLGSIFPLLCLLVVTGPSWLAECVSQGAIWWRVYRQQSRRVRELDRQIDQLVEQIFACQMAGQLLVEKFALTEPVIMAACQLYYEQGRHAAQISQTKPLGVGPRTNHSSHYITTV